MTQQTATFTLRIDVSRAVRAFEELARTFERIERRNRRHHTHVWERPAASRMHASYRAKTRRRNRR
jgi:hypothetical protein